MREKLLSRARRRAAPDAGGLRALIAEGAGALRATSASPRSESEILLAHVLGLDRAGLLAASDASLTAAVRRDFRKLVANRARGEPVAYLLGRREFWSLSLKVTPDVLIPRPETELLVEWGVEIWKSSFPRRRESSFSILDLGTGSGAIALAFARECAQARIAATDISPKAIEVARRNAAALDIRNVVWKHADFKQELDSRLRGNDELFDVIVSNPPYVAEGDPHLADLKFEPQVALTAGADGLRDLRVIVAGAPARQKSGGWLLVEHGAEQGAAVRELFAAAGFERVETRRDLAGLERATGGRYP